MKKTHDSVTGKGSAIKHYQEVIVGRSSLWYFLYFELCLLLAPLPGAVGMVLRKLFWPRLFQSCGKGVLFGTNVVLRHPCRVKLGNKVVVSDGCIIDARNAEEDVAISVGDEVMFSNDVMLSCKNGAITIGDNSGINAGTIIQSTSGCRVSIGKDVVIGQRCFVIAGGNYNTDNIEIPIRLQGIKPDDGAHIGDNVWLGGNVTVLGGAEIGSGSIVGACSLVTKSIGDNAVCIGIPAKVVRYREDNAK